MIIGLLNDDHYETKVAYVADVNMYSYYCGEQSDSYDYELVFISNITARCAP